MLVARNVGEVALPAPAYVPVNVGAATVLVALARRSGLSWAALGLGRHHVGRGLRVGGAAASVATAAMLAGAAFPTTRGFLDDERVAVDAGASELYYQVLVRIPVGTVAFEELAFRGVLLALLARRLSLKAAVVVDSALFGLWHIVPTLATARANEIAGPARMGLVVGAVVVTGVGGVVFCALRLGGRHLLAPAMLHVAFNDVGYLLAWWVRS